MRICISEKHPGGVRGRGLKAAVQNQRPLWGNRGSELCILFFSEVPLLEAAGPEPEPWSAGSSVHGQRRVGGEPVLPVGTPSLAGHRQWVCLRTEPPRVGSGLDLPGAWA